MRVHHLEYIGRPHRLLYSTCEQMFRLYISTSEIIGYETQYYDIKMADSEGKEKEQTEDLLFDPTLKCSIIIYISKMIVSAKS